MQTKKVVFTGLFIAIAFVLAQIVKLVPMPMPGAILLPMHIPVLLAGFLLGVRYGLLAGVLSPIVSMLLTGMPMLMPIGISMIFELATYGVIAGYFYQHKQWNAIVTLILSMLIGRIMYGIAATILFGIANMPFGFDAFKSAALTTAFPGIIIQLIAIPAILYVVNNSRKTRNISFN